jgi:hypothetical protein
MPPDPIVRPQVNYLKERKVREHGSPIESLGISDTLATRSVWVPWEQRFIASRAILGYSKLQRDPGDNSVVGLNRLTPLPHPDIENVDTNATSAYLYATKITEIKPYKPLQGELPPAIEQSMVVTGGVASRSQFLVADITVQYENPLYEVLEDEDENTGWPNHEYGRFLRFIEANDSVEYITMPGGTLRYIKDGGGGPTGKTIAFNAGKIFPKQQLKYRWCRLPNDLYSPYYPATEWQKRVWGDPATATVPLIGKVNTTTFLGRRAGTMLFENIKPIPNPGMFGQLYEWDFEITIHYDPNGWNNKYFFTSVAADVADRGFYLVGAGTTYYTPDLIPPNYSIYNVDDLDKIFDVRDVI